MYFVKILEFIEIHEEEYRRPNIRPKRHTFTQSVKCRTQENEPHATCEVQSLGRWSLS